MSNDKRLSPQERYNINNNIYKYHTIESSDVKKFESQINFHLDIGYKLLEGSYNKLVINNKTVYSQVLVWKDEINIIITFNKDNIPIKRMCPDKFDGSNKIDIIRWYDNGYKKSISKNILFNGTKRIRKSSYTKYNKDGNLNFKNEIMFNENLENVECVFINGQDEHFSGKKIIYSPLDGDYIKIMIHYLNDNNNNNKFENLFFFPNEISDKYYENKIIPTYHFEVIDNRTEDYPDSITVDFTLFNNIKVLITHFDKKGNVIKEEVYKDGKVIENKEY